MIFRHKILLLTLHFHRRGGVETYTAEFADSLRRQGYEVEIVSCLQSGTGELEGFRHTGLAPEESEAMARHIECWPQVLEEYLENRDPVENMVIAVNPLTLPQAGPYARRHGKPYCTVFYGVEAWDLYDSLKSELRQGGTVVAISRYTAAAIERQVAPAAGPIRLIPPPVDTAKFYPGAVPAGLPRRLLTVSRLGPQDWFKGHEVVLGSLRWLGEQLAEPIEYWIVGEGQQRPALEARARELGLSDCVRFTGFVEDELLPDYYRRADLFVMPSQVGRQPDGIATGEGFGMVFAEAAACGCPSVGLAHGGASEAIADGVSGLALASADDVPGAMLRLLRDRQERDRLGRQAARWAKDQFALPVFDARLQRLLQDTGLGRHDPA